MAREFQITHDGTDYGTFTAESPDAALIAALLDADRTRQYDVTLVSNSASFGKAFSTTSLWGNGGQDTSRFFYVVSGTDTWVFTAEEPAAYD